MNIDDTVKLQQLVSDHAIACRNYREDHTDESLTLVGSTMADVHRFVASLVDKASQKS